MEITFGQLIEYLSEHRVRYTLCFEGNARDTYLVATIRRIVDGGFYYLTKEVISRQSEMANSMVITDAGPDDLDRDNGNVFIVVSNPQLVYFRVCQLLVPEMKTGIHPSAIIHPEAQIGMNCYIGPYCVIGKSVIGDRCTLVAHVVVDDGVVMESGIRIESHSYLGGTGISWTWGEQGERVIQPQFGGVYVERDCFLGAGVSVVRGSGNEDTFIGMGTLIAQGTRIGHGSHIGELSHIANNVTIAGNAVFGARCFFGAGAVISSQVTLGSDCVVGAGAVVIKSFDENRILLFGVPAKRIKTIGRSEKLKAVPVYNNGE